MNQLYSINHEFPVTLYIPGAFDQRFITEHNGCKHSGDPWQRYRISWSWYGQFEVG